MASTETPVLDLSTDETKREHIRIDKKLYPLADPEDMSLDEYKAYSLKYKELARLWDQPLAGGKIKARRLQLLDVLTRRVLEAPDAVHRKLKPKHKVAIILAFSRVLRAAAQGIRANSAPAAAAPQKGKSVSKK
jgi:hypothetical protein